MVVSRSHIPNGDPIPNGVGLIGTLDLVDPLTVGSSLCPVNIRLCKETMEINIALDENNPH